MNMKAVAFLRAATITGYELACSRCPIVVVLKHDVMEPLPQHRCCGKPRPFDIVMELDTLVINDGRIDEALVRELSE